MSRDLSAQMKGIYTMLEIESFIKQNQNLVENFSMKDVIFYDGEPSNDKMYIIVSGSVAVYKNYGMQGEVCIMKLPCGAFFGEMSLFLNKGRTATVVAQEDLTLLVLDRVGLRKFIKEDPDFACTFIESLCTRLDSSNINTADLANEKVELKTISNTDALTGVYNRRYFMENAAFICNTGEIRRESFYIAIFDLDFFKKVNDTYGHQAGDYVLQCFSKMATNSIHSDDIFARYGGEEFALFMACLNAEDAFDVVNRIRKNAEGLRIEFEGKQIPITTSIGVAHVEKDGDIEKAIAFADLALYKAKNEGRNQALFYQNGM